MPELIFFIALCLYNLYALFLMGFDKRRAARGGRRIRERTLFILSAALAGPGIWAGMYTYRHKTKHASFVWWVPILSIAEYALLGYVIYKMYF